jgi:hypothetical protein
MTPLVRRCIVVILLLGLVGTGVELLLMEHVGDPWQLVPVVLIAAAILVLPAQMIVTARPVARLFQFIMLLFLISGMVGMGLHYRAKVEFKLEMEPGLSGLALFREAMKGTMPPALAPGSMVQLGLLGLVYTYKHPVFDMKEKP